jgi:glutaredoxin
MMPAHPVSSGREEIIPVAHVPSDYIMLFSMYNQDRSTNIFSPKTSTGLNTRGGVKLADTQNLIIYTLEYCPNCEILKEYLTRNRIAFDEKDMSTAESLTELRICGVFVNEAPVLRSGNAFLTSRDLFSGGSLREEKVFKLSEGS